MFTLWNPDLNVVAPSTWCHFSLDLQQRNLMLGSSRLQLWVGKFDPRAHVCYSSGRWDYQL